MAEVKKSWFLALDPGASTLAADDATAAQIEGATSGFKADLPAAGSADDRTAFVLEPSGLPDLSLDYEEVTRDVIRDSYLPAAPLRGVINSTGSMSYELHGGGMNGTALALPDQHVLHKSAFGASRYNGVAVSLASGPTGLGSAAIGDAVTGIDASGLSPAVATGDVVVLHETVSDNYYIVQLDDVTTNTACTGKVIYDGGAPDATPSWEIAPFVAYWMPSSMTKIPNFAIAYYRGNIVREIYAKCAVTSAEFPFSAGELVIPQHSFSIGDGAVASAAYFTPPSTYDTIFASATTNLSSNTAGPLFAKSVNWTFEYADVSASTPTWTTLPNIVDSFTLTLNNEPSEKKDITAPEGIAEYGVQSRSVEISLSCFYDDTSADFSHNLTSLFTQSDSYRIRVRAISGATPGNRVMVFSPRLSFKPSVTDDSGAFKYDVSGTAEKDTVFGETAMVCVYF